VSKYKLSFKNTAALLKYIEEQGIQFINCNFTDLLGKWHHISQNTNSSPLDLFNNGITIDNSSIAGWAAQDASILLIKPDISRVSYDPFAAQKTIKVFCDIYDLDSNLPYELDPRNAAKKAQDYLKISKIGDVAYFGSEIEFFIFDDVKVINTSNQVGYHLDGEEGSYNKGREYPTGNMGHRPSSKEGFLSESPVDGLSDIRAEMLSVIESVGANVERHYHAAAPSQCGIGLCFADLLEAADNVQLYKHVVHNVAHSYGRSATFMPKPINGEQGSAMRINQAIWKNGVSIFSGKEYADLSEIALHYIGGILKHAGALSAFTNPSTNSYKRLRSNDGAPTLLGYSRQNKLAACRIPYTKNTSASCINAGFPDPIANPYLAFSAMLMAGLDGIENKIHPGVALDENNVDSMLPPHMCGSLRQAIGSLEADHAFLLKGNVFTNVLIEAYIALKTEELERYESVTHPVEVDMYYSS
jgi:glutamine synthetase